MTKKNNKKDFQINLLGKKLKANFKIHESKLNKMITKEIKFENVINENKSQLPEKIHSQSVHLGSKELFNIKQKKKKIVHKIRKVVNNSSSCSVDKNTVHSDTVQEDNSKLSGKFADIKHKNCGGNNNWLNFAKENNIKETNVKKSNNFHSPNINTKVMAMDCEMVGIGEDGRDDMLARVSIVNAKGECIYDKYVKPREAVTDYRTFVSGIRPSDIKNGVDFEIVQKEIADILKNKILVGHAIKNDLDVLFLKHPFKNIRDTSKFYKKKGMGTPSLKKLALEILNVNIQHGEHNSVEDAKAALHLYLNRRKEWETSLRRNKKKINQ